MDDRWICESHKTMIQSVPVKEKQFTYLDDSLDSSSLGSTLMVFAAKRNQKLHISNNSKFCLVQVE